MTFPNTPEDRLKIAYGVATNIAKARPNSSALAIGADTADYIVRHYPLHGATAGWDGDPDARNGALWTDISTNVRNSFV